MSTHAQQLSADRVRAILDSIPRSTKGVPRTQLDDLVRALSPDGSIARDRALRAIWPAGDPDAKDKQLTNLLLKINSSLATLGPDAIRLCADSNKHLKAHQRELWFAGSQNDAALGAALSADNYRDYAKLAVGQNSIRPIGPKLPLRGFVIYAHADADQVPKLLDLMHHHLMGSPRFDFTLWRDILIGLGTDWRDSITKALERSDFAILMISPALLNSEFVSSVEFPHFAESGKPLCPVMIRRVIEDRIEHSALEKGQIFVVPDCGGLSKSAFLDQRDAIKKDAFARELVAAIEQRLASDPSISAKLAAARGLSLPAIPTKKKTATKKAKTPEPVAPPVFAPDTSRIYIPPDTVYIKNLIQTMRIQSAGTRTVPAPPDAAPGGGDQPALDYLVSWAVDKDAPPYFALFGEYGVGKTTTLSKLAFDMDVARKTDPSVPPVLYLDLRNDRGAHNASDPINLRTILASVIAGSWRGAARDHTTPDALIRLVRDHGAIVLFDGLDERAVHLTDAQTQHFIRELWSILPPPPEPGETRTLGAGTPPLPLGKVLISCRSHFFREVEEQFSLFLGEGREGIAPSLYASGIVLPFAEEQIRAYLEHVLGKDRVEPAMSVITGVHNLRELAARPVLLKLITDQIGDLERDKAAGHIIRAASLYDGMVKAWLYRDKGKETFTHRHKTLLTEDLSAALWLSGKKEWSADKLEAWLDGWLYAHPQIRAFYEKHEPGTLYRDLFTATFLVRPGDAGSQFRFAHTSFQEYFLARYLYTALVERRREAWAMKQPSLETLDFLGDLLVLREDAALALKGLASLLERNTPQATRNAFRYWVRAMKKDAPMPMPTRVALAGENLKGWRIIGKTPLLEVRESERGFHSPVSPGGAPKTAANTPRTHTQSAEGTPAGVHGAMKAPLQCSLPALDLTGAKLTDSCWQHIAMPGVKFAKATAKDALFRHCDFTGAVWDGGDFENCDLIHAIGLPELLPTALQRAWCVPGNTAKWEGKPRTLQESRDTPHQWTCAWSPESTAVLSASGDNTLRIWDAATGTTTAILPGHTNEVFGCAWSPDGTAVLSASGDHTLRIWDAATGTTTAILSGHTSWVRGCAWSPDGTAVLSASSDNTLRIWDAATGAATAILSGHTNSLFGCAWSPDGTAVLSASRDHTLRIWDAATGTTTAILSGHTNEVNGCAWSQDGSTVLSASDDGTLRIWDATTHQPQLALLTPRNAPGAAVDLTRNLLLTDAGDAWRNWRWKVEGTERTLPLEAFTAP